MSEDDPLIATLDERGGFVAYVSGQVGRFDGEKTVVVKLGYVRDEKHLADVKARRSRLHSIQLTMTTVAARDLAASLMHVVDQVLSESGS